MPAQGGRTISLFGGEPDGDMNNSAFIYDDRVAHLPGDLGNIWSNGAGRTSYSYYVYTYGQGYALADANATFSVTASPVMPEPST